MTGQSPAEVRLALKAAGFTPVACVGKNPVLPEWQNRRNATAEEIAKWPGGNSGILTGNTPGCDADVDDPEASACIDELARDWFDGRGIIPTRFGRPPRRALLFRTSTPFRKIAAKFVAPNGSKHKIEFLGEGQQVVVHGIHPGTGKRYAWHAGLCPWNIKHADLVEITEQEAHEFVDYVADVLKERFGFERVEEHGANGHDKTAGAAEVAAPFDVEAKLGSLSDVSAEEAGGATNDVQMRTIASLLRKGVHPGDVLDQMVTETMTRAGNRLGWDRDAETKTVIKRILSTYRNLLLKDYDPASGIIPDWLPGEFHEKWLQVLADGRCPAMHFNLGGFLVRGMHAPAGEGRQAKTQADPATGNSPPKFRFKLVPFGELRPGIEPLYLVDELIPVAGLVDVWGKAKCYKSFWCLDLMLHVAMGWEYRDRYVRQGAVVYCAFEGAHGYKKRVEALRRHYTIESGTDVPLYVMPGQANLITEHKLLIADIAAQLGDTKPVAVVLDTLNKSLFGSENKDVDMGAYVRAAEAIRDVFGCVVIIVHHCGYDDTRPRGHSSLPGAVDAQLAVTRAEEIITVTVEMMRDGPEDTQVVSAAEVVEVGQDQNGKTLTSLVIVPSEASPAGERHGWPRGLAVFHAALKAALASHGQAFQPEAGVLPVRAVDQWLVRDRFYATYAEAEDDEQQAAGQNPEGVRSRRRRSAKSRRGKDASNRARGNHDLAA